MDTERTVLDDPSPLNRAQAFLGCLLAAVEDPKLIGDARTSLMTLSAEERLEVRSGLQMISEAGGVLAAAVPCGYLALAQPGKVFTGLRKFHAR